MNHNATMNWFDAFEAKLQEDIEFFNQTWPERLVYFKIFILCLLAPKITTNDVENGC